MRYIFLDFLRVIALVLLVSSHIILWSGIQFSGIFSHKWLFNNEIANGVSLFLIVSGLVLELKYGQTSINYTKFIIKRLKRIYPVYWACLLFGIIIYWLRTVLFNNHSLLLINSIKPLTWICSITGFCVYTGDWGGPFVATGWYISLIICLYFIYPLIAPLIRKKPWSTLIFIAIVSFTFRYFLKLYKVNFPIWFYRAFPLSRLFEFSIGIFFVRILKTDVWLILNKFIQIEKPLRFLSDISFPLFLIHYPLLFIFPLLFQKNITPLFAIGIYLLISIIISWVILKISSHKLISNSKGVNLKYL